MCLDVGVIRAVPRANRGYISKPPAIYYKDFEQFLIKAQWATDCHLFARYAIVRPLVCRRPTRIQTRQINDYNYSFLWRRRRPPPAAGRIVLRTKEIVGECCRCESRRRDYGAIWPMEVAAGPVTWRRYALPVNRADYFNCECCGKNGTFRKLGH